MAMDSLNSDDRKNFLISSYKIPSLTNDLFIRDQMKDTGIFSLEIFQKRITWLVGIPHSNQTLRKRSRLEHFLTASVGLMSGLFLSCLVIIFCHYIKIILLLLPISWALTTYGLRKLKLTIMHAASHNNLTQISNLDWFIGKVISIIVLSEPFEIYRSKHTGPRNNYPVHHSRELLTPGEDTFEYIKSQGFKSGVQSEDNWKHLHSIIYDPCWYYHRCLINFKTAFCSSNRSASIHSLLFWLVVVLTVSVTQQWLSFIISYVIPRMIIVEISLLLRMLVEHCFIYDKKGSSISSKTRAIFCGEPVPKLSKSLNSFNKFLAIIKWLCRMLIIHLPCRFLILTGDTPQHDMHHARPNFDWANSITERYEAINNGLELKGIWGFKNAIDYTFKTLRDQPPNLFNS